MLANRQSSGHNTSPWHLHVSVGSPPWRWHETAHDVEHSRLANNGIKRAHKSAAANPNHMK